MCQNRKWKNFLTDCALCQLTRREIIQWRTTSVQVKATQISSSPDVTTSTRLINKTNIFSNEGQTNIALQCKYLIWCGLSEYSTYDLYLVDKQEILSFLRIYQRFALLAIHHTNLHLHCVCYRHREYSSRVTVSDPSICLKDHNPLSKQGANVGSLLLTALKQEIRMSSAIVSPDIE